MKKSLLIMTCLILYLAGQAYCQQKPVSTQYMFNGLVLNPAYAGSLNYFSATVMYRKQWVNMDGAPETKAFSAHSNIKGKNIGLGVMAVHDQTGVHSDMAFYASYAYRIRMREGFLAMGLQAGFNDLTSRFSNLSLHDPNDPGLSYDVHQFKMNFGTGVYYNSESFYAGLSIPYLLKSRTLRDFEYIRESIESRYYYFTAGKVLDVSHHIKIKPSVLMRIEDGMPVAYDFNCNIFLDELVSLGLSYREGDSFSTLFEMQLTDFIKFGYAYDWTASEIRNYSNGTHEFMVNYRMNLYAPKKNRMCPGPMYF